MDQLQNEERISTLQNENEHLKSQLYHLKKQASDTANMKDSQIQQLVSKNFHEKRQYEETIKTKDDEIKNVHNQIKQLKTDNISLGYQLRMLTSILLNEDKKLTTQQSAIFQESGQKYSQMDIERLNQKQPNDSNSINDNYILLYNHLSRDYQSLQLKFSSQSKNQNTLQETIKKQENIINNLKEILIKISQQINEIKHTIHDSNQIQGLINQGIQGNYVNQYLKCCNGYNEIVNCKQMSCIYHINCLYPRIIRQGKYELNNCDCGQPFPLSILRKVNVVEAKCLLDKILENQLQKLTKSLKQNDKRFLYYICSNLFCSFQWMVKPNLQNFNEGSFSYCPNCETYTQSEIKQI